jgi:UDP-GlcNAc:undecaprenyl-phosphate GlcNAc-1-phosphate transferase
MRYYFLTGLISFAVTVLLIPLAIKIAKKTRTVAIPRRRDMHTRPIPYLGGLAMLCGVVAAIFFGSFYPYFKGVYQSELSPWILVIAAVFISVLGAIDDRFELDWYIKLLGQIAVGLFLASSGYELLALPLGGITVGSSSLTIIVTVFVIVFTLNAINFIDGLNGLAAGVVGIGGSAFFFYTYFLSVQYGFVTYASLAGIIMCAMIGACAGYWLFNFRKRAKIFMGDSGSLLLGLLFSCATITVTGQIDPGTVSNKQVLPVFLPIAFPVIVLLFPVSDAIISAIRRLWSGKSPFHPDSKHIHHKMVTLYKTQKKAVLAMYLWTFIFSYGFLLYIPLKFKIALCAHILLIILGALLTYKNITAADKNLLHKVK